MTTLHAQPYDISKTGFYFKTEEEYDTRSEASKAEEFEIQFIDGEDFDCELAKAMDLTQCNVVRYLNAVDNWDDEAKTRYIIAVGEGGYEEDTDPEDLEVDIYHMDSMKELAEEFVAEGLFGDVPKSFENYIDYEAIGRDLAFDYVETRINHTNIIYRLN